MADSHGQGRTADPQGQGHGETVAKHYNTLQEHGREARTESRIFYMRNLNNWIKSVLIGETLHTLKKERGHSRDISVLDMCSGKGGDLLKWKMGNISKLVCADIAGTSVEQSESRYKDLLEKERYKDRVFSAEFITADCSKCRLKDMYKDPTVQFDVCSCQFSFHYSFESFSQVQMMLQNAVECLKLGGYFIGTTPNSQEIVKRLKASEDMSFGNDVYRVTFDLPDKEDIPLFGARYNFHLEGVVDCPEFLVYFPVLEKMAEKHGMKLVKKIPFADFFNKHVEDREHKNLLGRMQALETYPPSYNNKLMGDPEVDYEHAKACIESLKEGETEEDRHNRRRPLSIGTLSKAEWEAATIYCVFIFQKVRDVETGEVWSKPASETDAKEESRNDAKEESRKRRSNEGGDEGPPKVLKTS